MSAAKTKLDHYGGIISKTLKVRKLNQLTFRFSSESMVFMCRENPRRSGILLEEICQEDQRVCPLYGHFAPPGGVLRVSSDRDDRMRAKIKTPKNLKGPKIPGPKFNPPKLPWLNFRAIKIYSQDYAAGICWNCQITNLHIVLNIPKNSYLIKLPKRVPAKISNPLKS